MAPVILILVIFVALAATMGLAVQPAASPSPAATSPLVTTPPVGSPATLGRFGAAQEQTYLSACESDSSAGSVPPSVAAAFCVCTLNQYEMLYPSYDAMQAAAGSGALDQKTRDDISQRCVRSVLGG